MCGTVVFLPAGRCPRCSQSDSLTSVEAYECNGIYSLVKPRRCVFNLVKEYAVIDRDHNGRDEGTSDVPCIECDTTSVEPEVDERLIHSFLQRCRIVDSYYLRSSQEENYPPSSHATRSDYSSQRSVSTMETIEPARNLTNMSLRPQSTARSASEDSHISSEGSSDRSVDILADDEEFQAQRDERARIGDRWRRQDHRRVMDARRHHRSEGHRNDVQRGGRSAHDGGERSRSSRAAERDPSRRDRERERRRRPGR